MRFMAAARSLAPRQWLPVVALVVTVLFVYQPAWRGTFIWDDADHVTHADLQSWRGLARIWYDVTSTVQYYPVLHSAFWFEHRLWGEAPIGYHLWNILLHATCAVLLALVLHRLGIPGAYLAAALFALHPINAESVAWISEQKNTLSGVFYLGAMLAYFRFDQTRRKSPYLCALLLFLLALLSKTVTATLPGALLVIFWWQRGRLSWKTDVLPLVPLFLMGAGLGMITVWWEIHLNRCVGPGYDLPLIERFLVAGRAVWFYLGKLLWPVNLTIVYPRWQIDSTRWWQYVFVLAASGLTVVLWAIRRWARAPLAAWLFFVGTLFPALGFFNLYTSRYSFVANHYQYLASMGIMTLVSAGLVILLDRWRLLSRRAGYLFCLMLLAVLAALTWRQSQAFSNLETACRRTIAENPVCWLAHYNLAVVLGQQGQADEAIAHYRKTLEIVPDNAGAHNNLGSILAAQGHLDDAVFHLRGALKSDPHNATTHVNLGYTLAHCGHLDEAVSLYRKALEIDPNSPAAHNNLGTVLASQGRFDEALNHFKKVAVTQPNDADAQKNLAWLQATCPLASLRNGAEAIERAQRANELVGRQRPDILDALAAAYAEAGRFDEASATARQALELAVQQHDQRLADALQARVTLYDAGKPFHEARPR